MKNLFYYSILATMIFLLGACGTATSTPATTAASTLTPQPTFTTVPSTTPTPYPVTHIAGLVMAIHEIKIQPGLDSLQFTTLDGKTYGRAQMGSGNEFKFNWAETILPNIWVKLGNDKLDAAESYNDDYSRGWVSLTKNGQEIYKIGIGPANPTSALRGLWVYDTHWVLEVAQATQQKGADVISNYVVGQIVEDGVLLNEKYGYEEAFGFQTINGRPFYFFERHGKIDAWYDGQEIPLGFNSISHYGCCSASELNPLMFTNMVAFLGLRGDTRYLVQIGEQGTFNP
jgi:hypothetical protein